MPVHNHLACAFLFCVSFFCLYRATPAAYRGPQARGQSRAAAASLPHGHHDTRSEPRLQCALQRMAMRDP